jgi:hypothetical protein
VGVSAFYQDVDGRSLTKAHPLVSCLSTHRRLTADHHICHRKHRKQDFRVFPGPTFAEPGALWHFPTVTQILLDSEMVPEGSSYGGLGGPLPGVCPVFSKATNKTLMAVETKSPSLCLYGA